MKFLTGEQAYQVLRGDEVCVGLPLISSLGFIGYRLMARWSFCGGCSVVSGHYSYEGERRWWCLVTFGSVLMDDNGSMRRRSGISVVGFSYGLWEPKWQLLGGHFCVPVI
ncbi:hypothetical protein RHMOL_Rhmol01G0035900 [Rhododendron molle]|uniref:Uncharacterized protein n=1 Tax=Rhododendron molle TaxID=49168 RepID=A0ACC0PZM9_RHOML|nr:hypothetical protein RHMOL_Rhmol01G0035900 [Rhododendron molle]